MTRCLDSDEADTHNLGIRSENGIEQKREVTIICESGLYHAVLKSRRKEAKPFRRWVTEEVLPTIRRTRPTMLLTELLAVFRHRRRPFPRFRSVPVL